MEFKYNGHLTLKERIEQISLEIKEEYPNITSDNLVKIAALEEINNETEYNPLLHYQRLKNIMLVIKDKNDLNYIKANKELEKLIKEYKIIDE